MRPIPPSASAAAVAALVLGLLQAVAFPVGALAGSDQSLASPPSVVAVHGTFVEHGIPDGARIALVLSGLEPGVENSSPDGWTTKQYSGGTFEVRTLLPATGTADGALGERCGAGRFTSLRTRVNRTLGTGGLNGTLLFEESGPLGEAGQCAVLAGLWSPAPTPIPYGVHLFWQADLMEAVSHAEELSWGGVKAVFR